MLLIYEAQGDGEYKDSSRHDDKLHLRRDDDVVAEWKLVV